MSSKKVSYLKKTVEFHGKQLVMFSIDGATWSSRKEELQAIIERHEQERQNFGGQIKGGPQAKKTLQPEPAEATQSSVAKPAKTKLKTVDTKKSKSKEKSTAKIKNLKARASRPKVQAAGKAPAKKTTAKSKLPEPKKRTTNVSKGRKSSKSRRKVA